MKKNITEEEKLVSFILFLFFIFFSWLTRLPWPAAGLWRPGKNMWVHWSPRQGWIPSGQMARITLERLNGHYWDPPIYITSYPSCSKNPLTKSSLVKDSHAHSFTTSFLFFLFLNDREKGTSFLSWTIAGYFRNLPLLDPFKCQETFLLSLPFALSPGRVGCPPPVSSEVEWATEMQAGMAYWAGNVATPQGWHLTAPNNRSNDHLQSSGLVPGTTQVPNLIYSSQESLR